MYPDLVQTWGPDPECEKIGNEGCCGKTCPVYQKGLCEAEEEIEKKDDKDYAIEIEQHIASQMGMI